MAKRVGIVGGGGHGKVIADLVRAAGHRVVGYIDADPAKVGQLVEPGGAVVLMAQDGLVSQLRRGVLPPEFDCLALAVGDNRRREELLELIPAHYLPALVHPGATVSPSATLGAGTVVLAAAVVNAGAVLGQGVIVNSGAIVEHDCRLGNAVHVSPGAVLAGEVRVGHRGWIGAGATVLPRLSVGADTIIGAGAVLLVDAAEGSTMAGNPARAMERRTG